MYLKSVALLHVAQIAAIAVAKTQDGAARAEHLLPKMRKGMRGCGSVDENCFRADV